MYKFTTNPLIHQIPAGIMIGDNSTELFACRETQKVFALSKGKTIPFNQLDPLKRALIFEKLLSDDIALEDLRNLSQNEAIEKFAFCVYGAADHEPDFDDKGELKKVENFICSTNCMCLKWQSKCISVDGNKLTPREIQIVMLLASDKPEKQIADQLEITESTLNTHKKHLFDKFNVHSKSGLITKAITNKIIQ
jgi:DNA-binding CsgD family transcriptional regulator